MLAVTRIRPDQRFGGKPCALARSHAEGRLDTEAVEEVQAQLRGRFD